VYATEPPSATAVAVKRRSWQSPGDAKRVPARRPLRAFMVFRAARRVGRGLRQDGGVPTHDHLSVEDGDGIRTITIDRPEAKNALTVAMRTGLCELLAASERDQSVRVVILTAVDPVFTAGVDFKERRDPGWNPYDAQFAVNPGKALRAMATPVICAVNGACVSGGLELALSSSFVVASDRARFADTHARLGVVAAWGLTALLPRAVGVRKASEMSMTGNFVDADEALRSAGALPARVGRVAGRGARPRIRPHIEAPPRPHRLRGPGPADGRPRPSRHLNPRLRASSWRRRRRARGGGRGWPGGPWSAVASGSPTDAAGRRS